ncbi:hypothetical protein KVV02_001425 [Mortierella alpina]|uniref:Rab-GAP TBC domain-containing protein n=1 Tax=Mortierella alpina TaxID=64518 RepID=A0A9P8D1A1_MORAP|nr:hypothetical protein KVV02_001425 [Mortierella alpina]
MEISLFESCLDPTDGQVLCRKEFNDLCFGGIPDKPGIRQTCWKILLGYLPLDKSKWESRRMEQRRLYYSFVKDLIVEPQLEGPDLSLDEDESFRDMDDPERSLFLQDNKTLEQIDKDVRRTLPDFAFFQLPIPYSPLCPLSIDPETRKLKKRTPSNTGIMTWEEFGTTNGSIAAGSLTSSGPPQRRGTVQGTSVEMKRASITRAMTPNMKRRQTVTLMSPRAESKKEKSGDIAAGQTAAPCNQQAVNGNETPPLSPLNEFKTPSNYSSPAPAGLRGMTASAPGYHDEDDISLPDYLFSPIPTRRSLFKRVAHLNQDFGSREHQPHSLQKSRSKDKIPKGQPILKSEQKQEVNFPLSNSPVSLGGWDDSSEDELPQDLHWEAIERILFIFAKLNPGVGYVQGMNEILGPLYYLLANDPDEVSKAHAEAESFWLFHLLMAHFRDHFMRSLDRDRASGIGSSIARMNQRLRLFDEQLWQNLEEKGIAPEYYSFRWLTVLCTQEFDVPDVWRIWDSILADTGGTEKDYDFLLDFGCAMVCHLRDQLLDGDFADNVKLLQNYPPVDIQPILQLATVVRDRRIHPTTLHIALRNEAHEPPSRPSMDIRIWSSRSSISEQYTVVSTPDHWYPSDMKALTIDGVQNSDRLDHSLEGSYHGSPMHTPMSATFNKDAHQSNVEPSQHMDLFASISLFR